MNNNNNLINRNNTNNTHSMYNDSNHSHNNTNHSNSITFAHSALTGTDVSCGLRVREVVHPLTINSLTDESDNNNNNTPLVTSYPKIAILFKVVVVAATVIGLLTVANKCGKMGTVLFKGGMLKLDDPFLKEKIVLSKFQGLSYLGAAAGLAGTSLYSLFAACKHNMFKATSQNTWDSICYFGKTLKTSLIASVGGAIIAPGTLVAGLTAHAEIRWMRRAAV